MSNYPKRLIEVDLPIKRISAHARREKSIRHGHISTLHIWWARRPLAACRAVICASLWPDPADELCPQAFRDKALESIKAFAQKVVVDPKLAASCHPETMGKYLAISGRLDADAEKPKASGKDRKKRQMPTPELNATDPVHLNILQCLLLDFIADFANWDNSTVPEYLETSRALTQAAHEALGGMPGTRPLVVDPFAGGGSIPIEAVRVGAEAFASDLNPAAVLLNKVVLEHVPKYGRKLVDEVRKWGDWMNQEAENALADFYPRDSDGATPIAYLWARTIRCEGPSCGAEVPLLRSLWLSRKGRKSVALKMAPNLREKRVGFQIIENAAARDNREGTVKRGSATCPCCGFTTRVDSVRRQLKERRGGANDARMFAVVITRPGEQGRSYRLPSDSDLEAVRKAAQELEKRRAEHIGSLSLVPDEPLDVRGIRHTWAMIYGMANWGDLFNSRQALALSTLVELVTRVMPKDDRSELRAAVRTCLAIAVDSCADHNASVNSWRVYTLDVSHVFGRQAIPMAWDYAETLPSRDSTGSLGVAIDKIVRVLEAEATLEGAHAQANLSSATQLPLPDDVVDAFFTDPPYYDAVPYAYLSDFFYVWLRRMVSGLYPDLFAEPGVPKDCEIVVDRPHELSNSTKDIAFYEAELTKAFADGRRVLRPEGIATIVFASKTTASWEAILQAVVNAGWTITGSWPVDTEMPSKLAAIGQARLMSSIHLICRPRENLDGSLQNDNVGDWRDLLHELPIRIHEWMPRLAREGVVGADAIFACLGPALEIFSRYSCVEKASGEPVSLRDYLAEIWAAVSREALTMILEGADATGFEEDSRITAMWLWTLSTEADGNGSANGANGRLAEQEDSSDDDEESGSQKQAGGFTLEYDAARKIAQGLGCVLENLIDVVEIKGETARLLPVAERAHHLFGKDELNPTKQRKKRDGQMNFDGMLDIEEESDVSIGLLAVKSGETTLDRIHQSMLLFSAGRSEALQRFLVEDGIGRDQRFWKLAQALSALYPKESDEKRWVDGVLARKKGLGL